MSINTKLLAAVAPTHKQRALRSYALLAEQLSQRPAGQVVLDVGGPCAFADVLRACVLEHGGVFMQTGPKTELRDKWAHLVKRRRAEAHDGVDLCLCTEVLEHLRDQNPVVRDGFQGTGARNLLSEARAVLKPGSGRLVLTTPNAASLRTLGKVLQGLSPMHYTRHIREYTFAEVKAMVEFARFSIVSHRTVNWRSSPGKALKQVVRAHGGMPLSRMGDTIITIADAKVAT